MTVPSDLALFIDTSHWVVCDYPVLKADGVEGIIPKATSGNYKVDDRFHDTAQGCIENALYLAPYHWNDPLNSGQSQADFYLKTIDPYLPHCEFLAIDNEQWWADWYAWNRWIRGEITQAQVPKLSPARIDDTAHELALRIKAATGKRVVFYGGAYFYLDYCPLSLEWLGEFDLWWAQWPYNRDRVNTTWENLIQYYLPPTAEPAFPNAFPVNLKRWDLWQFSGDKFYLPGQSGYVDLNYVKKSYLSGNIPTPPPVPAVEKVQIAVSSLNVRDNPYGNILTSIGYGKVAEVADQALDKDGKTWYQLKVWVAGWLTKKV